MKRINFCILTLCLLIISPITFSEEDSFYSVKKEIMLCSLDVIKEKRMGIAGVFMMHDVLESILPSDSTQQDFDETLEMCHKMKGEEIVPYTLKEFEDAYREKLEVINFYDHTVDKTYKFLFGIMSPAVYCLEVGVDVFGPALVLGPLGIGGGFLYCKSTRGDHYIGSSHKILGGLGAYGMIAMLGGANLSIGHTINVYSGNFFDSAVSPGVLFSFGGLIGISQEIERKIDEEYSYESYLFSPKRVLNIPETNSFEGNLEFLNSKDSLFKFGIGLGAGSAFTVEETAKFNILSLPYRTNYLYGKYFYDENDTFYLENFMRIK